MGVRLIGESSACSGNWRRVRVQWTQGWGYMARLVILALHGEVEWDYDQLGSVVAALWLG